MFYKNLSYIAKTFYGVTFQPGEIKEVDGIINDKMVVPVDDSATKAVKPTQQKPSPEQPKDEKPVPEPLPAKENEPKLDEKNESKEEQVKSEEKQGKGKKS